jgi:hypothetical protein
MKIEKLVKDVSQKLVKTHFVSVNDVGLLLRLSFRTRDTITCISVQDMLNESLKGIDDKPELIVNILDFHIRDTFEWCCLNTVSCCLPLAIETFQYILHGPYYQIEVWKKITPKTPYSECHVGLTYEYL